MQFDLTKAEVSMILSAISKSHEIKDSDKSADFPASALYWKLLDSKAQLDMIEWIERNTAD